LTENDTSNTIRLDSINPHSGNQCLIFFAAKSENGASKSDIAHNKLAFHEGNTFYGSCWFYLEGAQSLDYIFLFDLEESVPIGAGTGIRVALAADEAELFLVLERNKLVNEATLIQTESDKIAFTRNEWVHLELSVLMKRNRKGTLKICQNNLLIIDESGLCQKTKLFSCKEQRAFITPSKLE
jgi:hypothetical protein